MPQVKMLTGPFRGQTMKVFAHEVSSLVSSGQAELAPPPAKAEVEALEAPAEAPKKKSGKAKK